MSTTAEKMAMEYPVPTYRFYVTVGDEEITFNDVSDLNNTHPDIEYTDAMGSWYGMPSTTSETNITLRKGIFRGQIGFYNWISSLSLNTREKKNMTISLKSESGSDLTMWKVTDAFPISFTAPSLDATSDEAVIEELRLCAKSIYKVLLDAL
ncbi:hypothetical protein BGX24_012271 [Mortierella sp. AD032]|nr:hypothetical protein BGX24_012271 [Mortierella sp. AD032]